MSIEPVDGPVVGVERESERSPANGRRNGCGPGRAKVHIASYQSQVSQRRAHLDQFNVQPFLLIEVLLL